MSYLKKNAEKKKESPVENVNEDGKEIHKGVVEICPRLVMNSTEIVKKL